MGAAKRKPAGKPNPGGELQFAVSRTVVPWLADTLQEAKRAITAKCALDGESRPKLIDEIALRAKRSTRIVQRWFKGSDQPNGEALVNLMCSDMLLDLGITYGVLVSVAILLVLLLLAVIAWPMEDRKSRWHFGGPSSRKEGRR